MPHLSDDKTSQELLLLSSRTCEQLAERVDSLALSPDGSRLYVGGTFSALGGAARSGLAAVDTTTGAVDPTWNPSPEAFSRAIWMPGGVCWRCWQKAE